MRWLTLALAAAAVLVGCTDDGVVVNGIEFINPTTPTVVETPSGSGCAALVREHTWFTEGGGGGSVRPEWDLLFENTCDFEIHVHAKARAFHRASGNELGFKEVDTGSGQDADKRTYQPGEVAWICENKVPGDGNDDSCLFRGSGAVLRAVLRHEDPVDIRFTWVSCNPEKGVECLLSDPPEPQW